MISNKLSQFVSIEPCRRETTGGITTARNGVAVPVMVMVDLIEGGTTIEIKIEAMDILLVTLAILEDNSI